MPAHHSTGQECQRRGSKKNKEEKQFMSISCPLRHGRREGTWAKHSKNQAARPPFVYKHFGSDIFLSFSLLRGSGGPEIRNCLCYSLLPALDVGQYHPYALHLIFNPQSPSLTCCSLGWQLRFLPAVPQLAVRQLQFFPTNAF